MQLIQAIDTGNRCMNLSMASWASARLVLRISMTWDRERQGRLYLCPKKCGLVRIDPR